MRWDFNLHGHTNSIVEGVDTIYAVCEDCGVGRQFTRSDYPKYRLAFNAAKNFIAQPVDSPVLVG